MDSDTWNKARVLLQMRNVYFISEAADDSRMFRIP